MANKVVIDTEINVVEAKKEIKSLESDLKKLEAEKKKTDETFATYKEMGIAPHEGEIKKYDDLIAKIKEAKNRIAELQTSITAAKSAGTGAEDKAQQIEKIKTASDRASKSIRKMGDSAKKSKAGFSIGLKSILKYAFGIRSLFALINKLRSAMVEGFKNLAQFNDGVNPTNTALSNLKSALTQLKNSFAVAFAPILTVVEPILTKLINMLSTAMNYVGQFFAALTGASSYTKAIKVQENYAKSLNGTATAAKKAKGSLASIDELNNQSKQDSSGGTSGTVSPNDMFEVAPIESKIAGLADKVNSIINPIKESLQNWFNNVNFQPLIDSFNHLKEAAQPIVDNIGNGLLWVFENVLEPLGSFVIEDALPKFFELLATAIETVNTVLDELKPSFEYLWNNILVPVAKFLGDTLIAVIDIVIGVLNDFKNMIVQHSDQINNILQAVMFVISLVVQNVKKQVNVVIAVLKPFLKAVVNIIGDIIDVLSGIIDFVAGVFTGDWERAWKGIKDIFRGIWNGIMDLTEGFVNMIVDALNTLSFDVPSWIPGIGGTTFAFDIPHLSLPHLASGTVVPRQSKEFMAVLGDNNRETEVVSPLSTMKQAMVEALQESGYYRQSESGDIVINIDGREVFRVVKKQNDSYISRTGRSAFQY